MMEYRSIYTNDELEHSMGSWAKDKVSYIRKYVGPSGKMVYEYAKDKVGSAARGARWAARSFSAGLRGVDNKATTAVGKYANAAGRKLKGVGQGLTNFRREFGNAMSTESTDDRKKYESFVKNKRTRGAGSIGSYLGAAAGDAVQTLGKKAKNARDFIYEKTGMKARAEAKADKARRQQASRDLSERARDPYDNNTSRTYNFNVNNELRKSNDRINEADRQRRRTAAEETSSRAFDYYDNVTDRTSNRNVNRDINRRRKAAERAARQARKNAQ